MENKLKKLLCVLCIVSMLAAAFTSCGKKEDNKAKDNNTAGTVTASENTLPIVKDGSVTLTIGTSDNYYTPASYTQNLPIWKAIEEKTGVKITWDVVPSSQYTQMMTVRLASMTNIPDMFNIPGDPVKYGADGILEPLEKLVDQYAPNIKKFYADNPDLYNLCKAPDGHMYHVSSVVTGQNLSDPRAWLIRKDWLDKLNLKEPTTIDEWYTVLKAFKERDPNGNGKADEQPLAFSSYALTRVFGDAWGLHLYASDGFWPDNNGKIQYEWMDPRAKELVVFLNRLYKEGLLDPDFLTTKDDQLNSKVTKDIVGANFYFINKADAFDKSLKKAGVETANWIAIAPPQGPNGYKGHTEKYGPVSGFFGMSSKSKYKEVAIRWLDYMFASEEGNRFTTFGIEGKSYVMENGEPKFTDYILNNPDGLDVFSALRTLGAAPTIPWIRNDKGPLSKQPPQTVAHIPKAQEGAKKVQQYMIDPYPTNLILATPEEASALKPLQADLSTKLDERLASFIIGTEDVNAKWDSFQKDLKNIGIDEIIKIRQQQYERYKK